MAQQRWQVRSAEDLGRAVAEIRALRGLTQDQLAQASGMERTYLARLEGGLSVKLVERALRALRRLGASVTVELSSDDGQE